MENAAHTACQWSGCIDPANKHAVFGRRLFDATVGDIKASRSRFLTHHRDLCDRHLKELKKQYVDVAIAELNSCCGSDRAGNAGRT
jgi:hypothetical protein